MQGISLQQYCAFLLGSEEFLNLKNSVLQEMDYAGVGELPNLAPIILGVSVGNFPFDVSVIGFAENDETLTVKFSHTSPAKVPNSVDAADFTWDHVELQIPDHANFIPYSARNPKVLDTSGRLFIATLNLETQELQYHKIVN